MRGLTVVIPSRTAANIMECVPAVKKLDPECRILVVDDGVKWHETKEVIPDDFMCSGRPFGAIPGLKPFVFARNVNIGIKYSGDDDVIVLNDDAILRTPNGFSVMQRAAEENQEYGIIGSTTNNVGNPNQYRRDIGLREDPRMVCFIAVLIPRRTIETVGLLDERYIYYGMDDDDYCFQVRAAGLKIGIHDGCFVDHCCLQSTYRGTPGFGGDYHPNLEIFKQKWGHDNWGKTA